LSAAAVEAARLRNPALRCLVLDAESLSFADQSFDWAIVREGLHHLARPLKGLYAPCGWLRRDGVVVVLLMGTI